MLKPITYLLLLISCGVSAQLKNFGTQAKIKPEPNYHYGVYGYLDVVREYGIGFQYQIKHRWNLDISAYYVHSNDAFKHILHEWNYNDFEGFGISLKPKLLLGRLNRLYVGANIAYEALHHDKLWVDYSANETHYDLDVLESVKGNAINIGATTGIKFNTRQIFIEPFCAIGLVFSNATAMIYDVKGSTTLLPKDPYPYSVSIRNPPLVNVFYHLNIGIKIGYSFKKNKNQETLHKKFDAVYVPKSNSLSHYFKTIAIKEKSTSINLKKAYTKYKALNRITINAYRKYRNDTLKFYNQIDELFNRIDGLINEINE